MEAELLNIGALNHMVIEGLRGAQNRWCELFPVYCDSILQHLEGKRNLSIEMGKKKKTHRIWVRIAPGGAGFGVGCASHPPREGRAGDALTAATWLWRSQITFRKKHLLRGSHFSQKTSKITLILENTFFRYFFPSICDRREILSGYLLTHCIDREFLS